MKLFVKVLNSGWAGLKAPKAGQVAAACVPLGGCTRMGSFGGADLHEREVHQATCDDKA